MAVIKDPDNKWVLIDDWTNWKNDQESQVVTGAITITAVQWFLDTGLVEEVETPGNVDASQRAILVGTGGPVGAYAVVCRITYDFLIGSLSLTNLTQDHTILVTVAEQ